MICIHICTKFKHFKNGHENGEQHGLHQYVNNVNSC